MRLIVTILSIGAIYAYGYALAGLGGYLLGRGNMTYAVGGLLGGTACAALALFLWRKNLAKFYITEDVSCDASGESLTVENSKDAEITLPNKL